MGIPSEYFDDAMVKLRSERFLNRPLESIAHPVSEVTKYAASEAEPVEKEQLNAQEWLERGYVFAVNHDLDEAIRCLTESIHLKPSHEAYYTRGMIHRHKGNLDEAIQDYDVAITMEPEKAENYNNRGNVRRDQGDLDGAISDYDTAIRLDENATKALLNRGVARRIQKDTKGALADFNEALRHKSEDADEVAETFYQRGCLRHVMGALDDAIKDYKWTLKSNPAHVMVWASRSFIRRKQGKSDLADIDEEVARSLLEDDIEYNQACLESILGNVDPSLKLLEIALRKKQMPRQWARIDPDFDNIRDDPHFKELVGE